MFFCSDLVLCDGVSNDFAGTDHRCNAHWYTMLEIDDDDVEDDDDDDGLIIFPITDVNGDSGNSSEAERYTCIL